MEAFVHSNIGTFTDPRAQAVHGGGLRGGPLPLSVGQPTPNARQATPNEPPTPSREHSPSVAAWPLNGAQPHPPGGAPVPAQPLVARALLQGPRGCTSRPRRTRPRPPGVPRRAWPHHRGRGLTPPALHCSSDWCAGRLPLSLHHLNRPSPAIPSYPRLSLAIAGYPRCLLVTISHPPPLVLVPTPDTTTGCCPPSAHCHSGSGLGCAPHPSAGPPQWA